MDVVVVCVTLIATAAMATVTHTTAVTASAKSAWVEVWNGPSGSDIGADCREYALHQPQIRRAKNRDQANG
jgi:hypothetical protein